MVVGFLANYSFEEFLDMGGEIAFNSSHRGSDAQKT